MGKSLKLAEPQFSPKSTDNNTSTYLVGLLEALHGKMVSSSEHKSVNNEYTIMEGSLQLISIHVLDEVIERLHCIFNDHESSHRRCSGYRQEAAADVGNGPVPGTQGHRPFQLERPSDL